MTGEQFLNSIRYLDNEINALDYERVRVMDQRQALLDAAQTWGGLTGVCVQHSPSSKTESIGIALASIPTPEQVAQKINAYQARLNGKIDRLVDKKIKVFETLDRITDDKLRLLILLRYVRNLKWSEIADKMGYCEHYVRIDVRQLAIPAFEKAWREKE